MKNHDVLGQQIDWLQISIFNKLRTLIVCALLSMTFISGYAQSNVISFSVGPYRINVDMETGVHKYEPFIDPVEFFEFKKDTIIQVVPTRLERGVQIVANSGVSGLIKNGGFKHYDISGGLKQQLNGAVYLNVGLSAGLSTGVYGSLGTDHYRKDRMIEIGVPVSLEVTNLYQDYEKVSLYGGVGFTPAFYKTTKIDKTSADKVRNANVKDFGLLVSPRFDFGAYIPVFGQVLRVGIYGEYRICCFHNVDIYKKRVSKSILGVNIGIVL